MLVLIILLFILAALILLEILSLKLNLDRVFFRCEVDMDLTEPDEIVTLSYRLRNTAPWPMMFVSFTFSFGDEVEVRESEEWRLRYGSQSVLGETYTIDTYLLPRSTYKGRIRFSIKRRGRHELGKVYIETGDFLGLTSRTASFRLDRSVVCTAKACEDEPELSALGGMLGEISVRRFICEDPSLVLGYREYTGTEPLKSISWTQTAKTGQLTVKKHDFTVDNDVAVFVNIEHTERAVVERCLSLVRTACDSLEAAKIPYALYSNGDLFETAKGVGRTHCFEIQRRIGVASFVRYMPFSRVVERSLGGSLGKAGCIVITPTMTEDTERLLRRLSENSGAPACVLIGKEAAE